MSGLELMLALVVAVGLIGIVVPLLPGSLLIGAAVLVWAIDRGDATGWTVLAVAVTLLVAGAVVKYLIPGRRLQRSGVPTRTLLAGAVVGLAGFFVVPVLGLPLGFVLGVYLAEWQRTSRQDAWPATVNALKAVGLGILIELGFGLLATLVWVTGVIVT